MKWTKLKDASPDIDVVGEKVLIYRIVNTSQKSMGMTIYDTKFTKHCNPDETWWMQLPKAPV